MENVLHHQFVEYVKKSQGKDLDTLSDSEKEAMGASMMKDLYPGNIVPFQQTIF